MCWHATFWRFNDPADFQTWVRHSDIAHRVLRLQLVSSLPLGSKAAYLKEICSTLLSRERI